MPESEDLPFCMYITLSYGRWLWYSYIVTASLRGNTFIVRAAAIKKYSNLPSG